MVAHHDWLPTFLAIAGDTQVKDKLLKGSKVGDMTYKVHLDGNNLVPYLTGQAQKSPRESFLYINDDQQVTGLRYDNWKIVFMEQRVTGTMRIWRAIRTLRVPKIFNLRTDPDQRADITSTPTTTGCSITLTARTRAGLRWSIPDVLQGLSAEAEGGSLQSRRGDEEAAGKQRVEVAHTLNGCARRRKKAGATTNSNQQKRRQL